MRNLRPNLSYCAEHNAAQSGSEVVENKVLPIEQSDELDVWLYILANYYLVVVNTCYIVAARGFQRWLVGNCWGWSGNEFIVLIPGFTNLSNELILALELYNTNLWPYPHVFWPNTAPYLLNYPQTWGLALWKMVRLEYTSIYDSHPRLHKALIWMIWLWNGITSFYNWTHMCFESKQQHSYSVFLQNGVWLGKYWWCWSSNPYDSRPRLHEPF